MFIGRFERGGTLGEFETSWSQAHKDCFDHMSTRGLGHAVRLKKSFDEATGQEYLTIGQEYMAVSAGTVFGLRRIGQQKELLTAAPETVTRAKELLNRSARFERGLLEY